MDKKYNYIQYNIPLYGNEKNAIEKLKEKAKTYNMTVSQYVKELIKEDLKAK